MLVLLIYKYATAAALFFFRALFLCLPLSMDMQFTPIKDCALATKTLYLVCFHLFRFDDSEIQTFACPLASINVNIECDYFVPVQYQQEQHPHTHKSEYFKIKTHKIWNKYTDKS